MGSWASELERPQSVTQLQLIHCLAPMGRPPRALVSPFHVLVCACSLQGGVHGKISLTAYVVASLLETGVTSEVKD